MKSFCTALKPPASPAAARIPGGHAAFGRSRRAPRPTRALDHFRTNQPPAAEPYVLGPKGLRALRSLPPESRTRPMNPFAGNSLPTPLGHGYDRQVKHSSASSPATPTGHRLFRVGAVGVLSLAMVVAWTLMMNRAAETLSFQPNTDHAIVQAAAARPAGVMWALFEVAAVVMRARARARQLRGPLGTSEPKPPWPGLPG